MRTVCYTCLSGIIGAAIGVAAVVVFGPHPAAIEAATQGEYKMLRSSIAEMQYGPEPHQLADLVVPHPYTDPANRDAPLIVWLHWSGFAAGDKSVIQPYVLEFAKRTGLVCLSINYHLGTSDNPCWPQAKQDIAQAIHFARTSDQIPCVSPDAPVYLVGYSAGGTLAAKYAMENPGEVEAVAMVGGILDFDAWATLHPESVHNLVCGFGEDWASHCPSVQMAGEHPYILAMHGTLDTTVESAVNASIIGAPNFRLVKIGGATHACSERLDVVLAEVLKAFLR